MIYASKIYASLVSNDFCWFNETFLDLGGNTIRYRYQQQLREFTIF